MILCFTAPLSAEDTDAIYSLARDRGVALHLIGMGTLSHDLAEKYWGLAREYLGLNFDTGQVLERQEFVERQARTPLATSLERLLQRGNDIRLGDWRIVKKLVEVAGASRALPRGLERTVTTTPESSPSVVQSLEPRA